MSSAPLQLLRRWLAPLVVSTIAGCSGSSPTQMEQPSEYLTAIVDGSVQISSDSIVVIVQFSQGSSSPPTVLAHGYDGGNGGIDYRISVIAPPLSVGTQMVPDVSFGLTVGGPGVDSRSYGSDQQQGSGTLTFTEVSDSITVGVFEFEAVHVDGDPATPDVVSVTSGYVRIRTPPLGRGP